MTATTAASSALVRPFTVAIADSEIDDLRQRLARTRWPDPETVSDWSQGVRVENARSLVSYWEREYDWRRFESELNRFPQFLTAIDGLDIHFIHVKSKNPEEWRNYRKRVIPARRSAQLPFRAALRHASCPCRKGATAGSAALVVLGVSHLHAFLRHGGRLY